MISAGTVVVFIFLVCFRAVPASLVKTQPTGSGHQEHPLPVDLSQLQMLCTDVGLQKACKMLSTTTDEIKNPSKLEHVVEQKESGPGVRALRGVSAVSQTSRIDESRSEPISMRPFFSDLLRNRSRDGLEVTHSCLPPGKLVFQHVMKTGGISVESFLKCACAERPDRLCTIRIKANHWSTTTHPEGEPSDCSPSICSTHAAATDLEEACGEEFASATRFTTIREPVSRVWSFYNYLRRWYKPYKHYTLKEILQNYSSLDLNEGLQENEMCLHCHYQLSNAMVTHHYADADVYELVAGMGAIIDLRRLSDFPQISEKFALFPENPSLSGSTECTMQHQEATQYLDGAHPDPETALLIAQHNREDVMLYEYVQTLPQYES